MSFGGSLQVVRICAVMVVVVVMWVGCLKRFRTCDFVVEEDRVPPGNYGEAEAKLKNRVNYWL